MSQEVFRTDVLAGKSMLVTGCGSDLGKEVAAALAAKGELQNLTDEQWRVAREAIQTSTACDKADRSGGAS